MDISKHQNQSWYSIYKSMTLPQLKDEQQRILTTQFTDKDARLELLASEIALKAAV
jgi:hypothetical protein